MYIRKRHDPRFYEPCNFYARGDSMRRAVDPETGERIQHRTENEIYDGLVENAWAVLY